MRRIFEKKDSKTPSRQKIEDEAFAQMRKAKAAIDPGVLAKVRKAIQNSPMAAQLMGNVYAQDSKADADKGSVNPGAAKTHNKVMPSKKAMKHDSAMALERETAEERAKKEKAALAAKRAHASVKEPETEPVDQAKMLDVVAKMLEMNPHKQDLKKGVRDILKDK